MTQPANASAAKDGGRWYHWKDDPAYMSVTTALDILRKKPIEMWGPKAAAEYVVDNMSLIRQTLKSTNGRDAAIDLIKRAPYRSSDAAAGIGNLIHEVAQMTVLQLPRPECEDKHLGFVRSFEMFLEDWQPEYLHTESTVYNRTYGYAGTADAIIRVAGETWLVDYKTTRPGRQGHGIYPEAALQMSGYRHAEFIGLPNGAEEPLPHIDRCAGINLRPDGYKVVPVASDDKVWRAFLHILQVARFAQELDSLVGDPMAPPLRESA